MCGSIRAPMGEHTHTHTLPFALLTQFYNALFVCVWGKQTQC